MCNFNKIVLTIIIFGLNAYASGPDTPAAAASSSSFSSSSLSAAAAAAAVSLSQPAAANASSSEGGRKRKVRDESQETNASAFLAGRALLISKIQGIKNELTHVMIASDNKFVRNFIKTLSDDMEKIKIVDSDDLFEKLNEIDKKLTEIKTIASITQKDKQLIDGAHNKIASLQELHAKTIDLSKLQKPNERLDLINGVDGFTQQPFANLITLQQKSGKPFILARVEHPAGTYKNTQGVQVQYPQSVHYYDAHSLNKYIFNQYPLYPKAGKWNLNGQRIEHQKITNGANFGMQQAKDISNRAPLLVDNVHYFVIRSLKDNEFSHMASFSDLIQNEGLQKQFYANSDHYKAQIIGTVSEGGMSQSGSILSIALSGSNRQLAVRQFYAIKIFDPMQIQNNRPVTINELASNTPNMVLSKNQTLLTTNGQQILEWHLVSAPLRYDDNAQPVFGPRAPFRAFSLNLANVVDHTNDTIDSLAIDSTGQFIVAGDRQNATVWDLRTNSQVGQTARVNDDEEVQDGDVSIVCAGTTSYVTNNTWHKIDQWNLRTGAHIRTIAPAHESGDIVSMALSSRDRYLLLGYSDDDLNEYVAEGEEPYDYKFARIFNLQSPEQQPHTLQHKGKVGTVAISADEQYAMTGSGDTTAALWDIKTGKKLLTMKHDNPVLSVAISSDNKRAFTATYKEVYIWALTGF